MVRDSGRVSTLRHHYQDDLETFTWSALVAIGIAIKDHKIYSKMSEHLFIMHWLAIAKKRKIFSKKHGKCDLTCRADSDRMEISR